MALGWSICDSKWSQSECDKKRDSEQYASHFRQEKSGKSFYAILKRYYHWVFLSGVFQQFLKKCYRG